MTICFELTDEMAEFASLALRYAAKCGQNRISEGIVTGGCEQIGQLHYLATYIEHKRRDAR